MTINEYFLQEQPISAEVVNEIYFKDVQEITFSCDSNRYAKIKVAHIDIDTWAFGWEIKDGTARKALCRECTSNITTKGRIDKLIYGMTKVLQRQIVTMTYPTNILMDLVDKAVTDAKYYYRRD